MTPMAAGAGDTNIELVSEWGLSAGREVRPFPKRERLATDGDMDRAETNLLSELWGMWKQERETGGR